MLSTMPLLKAFTRLSRKSSPVVVADNMDLDFWVHIGCAKSTQFVKKVEMCTAIAAVQDTWGAPVDKNHHHTLLRVSLAPIPGNLGTSTSGDTLLIERVISTGGGYHSVTPITAMFSSGGTLFHPNVYDRVCIISEGPSTVLARRLQIERTITFGDHSCLSLAQFAQILDFVSRTTMLVCADGDCRFQSRSFAFTCMAALTPSLPPPTLVRKAGDGVGTNVEPGTEALDDSVFELSAEAFLGQVSWLIRDPVSVKALGLIGALKHEPRQRAKARLYH